MIFSLIGLLGCGALLSPAADPLVVHEWGTFTSMQVADIGTLTLWHLLPAPDPAPRAAVVECIYQLDPQLEAAGVPRAAVRALDPSALRDELEFQWY